MPLPSFAPTRNSSRSPTPAMAAPMGAPGRVSPERRVSLAAPRQAPIGPVAPTANGLMNGARHRIRVIGEDRSGTQLGEMFVPPGKSVDVFLEMPRHGTGAIFDRAVGGAPIMLGMTPGDVHDPTEASNILVGYKNNLMAALRMCPMIPRDYDEDKYRAMSSKLAFQPVKVKSDVDGDINELYLPSALTPYKMTWRRIGGFLSDPTVKQVTNPGYAIRNVLLKRARMAIDLDLELDILGPSGLLTTAANWASGQQNALAFGYQWGGPSGAGANSDPIHDLQQAAENSNMMLSHYWMNQRVANWFTRNPATRDHMRQYYGDDPLPAEVKIQDNAVENVDYYIKGVGTIHVVASRVFNTSAGTSTDFVMPDVVVGTVFPPGGEVPIDGEDIMTAGLFRYKGPAGVGYYTREFRQEHRGSGGTFLVVEEASQPLMIANDAGVILTNVLQ